MARLRSYVLLTLGMVLLLGGCATRPINPPMSEVDRSVGYRFLTRSEHFKDPQNLVILAFSGGGTRAAAFSYGVLEALRPMVVVGPKGNSISMLDEVDVITGVSGGSFTALAYGLYGDKLFDFYDTAFLKRNVQGELIRRVLSPGGWGDWGRSETASKLYDDILFHGATFADLDRGSGPLVGVSATDISTGARVGFVQGVFDFLCSDLDAVPLSRAATASSAVPFAFSPVTLNNYGGTCKNFLPKFLQPLLLRSGDGAAAGGARAGASPGLALVRGQRPSSLHPPSRRRSFGQPGDARGPRGAGRPGSAQLPWSAEPAR